VDFFDCGAATFDSKVSKHVANLAAPRSWFSTARWSPWQREAEYCWREISICREFSQSGRNPTPEVCGYVNARMVLPSSELPSVSVDLVLRIIRLEAWKMASIKTCYKVRNSGYSRILSLFRCSFEKWSMTSRWDFFQTSKWVYKELHEEFGLSKALVCYRAPSREEIFSGEIAKIRSVYSSCVLWLHFDTS
jgi:hypothetical protein